MGGIMLTDRQLRSMEASAQAAADNAQAAIANVEHQKERTQREEQGRWEDKLRDAYADWAAALFYAVIAHCDLGDAMKDRDEGKERKAKEDFDRRRWCSGRPIMDESRP
jgi:hypothetical protein